jgi:putative ABC transport system permease protein
VELTSVALSLILVAVALAVSVRRSLSLERELLVAVARAIGQLFLLAAAIQVVVASFGLTALLLFVMITVATWTSTRRLGGLPGAYVVAATSISVSSGAALLILFGARAFPLEPAVLIPIAGMLIGNTMTATSLAGSRLRDDVVNSVLDIEARLALGIRVSDALRSHVRRATVTALIPTIDSTKNVGLVFLPGAFVGMMIAGVSPARAAQLQLVVLFMLLGAVSLAAFIATALVARTFAAVGERIHIPDQLAE